MYWILYEVKCPDIPRIISIFFLNESFNRGDCLTFIDINMFLFNMFLLNMFLFNMFLFNMFLFNVFLGMSPTRASHLLFICWNLIIRKK